jgi:predicted dehydrogenase
MPPPSPSGHSTAPRSRQSAGLTLGIVGFGWLARDYYLPPLRALGGGVALAVADPSPAGRDAAARLLPGAPVFADADALFDAVPLDAVLVAAPPSVHLAIWHQAARRDLPVFMEKPFPLVDELDAIDPAAPGWERLMVDFNRRFWPPYRQVTDWVRGGAIGSPRHARITLHVDQAVLAPDNHRAQVGEGGVLHDLGSHAVDFAAVTFGTAVAAITGTRRGDAWNDERIALRLDYPGGLTVDCDLGYGGRMRESLAIDGDGGVIRLDEPNFRPWRYRRAPALAPLWELPVNTALWGWRKARRQVMLRGSVAAALHEFLDALRVGRPFAPGFVEAMTVATWLRAAQQAIDAGAPVRLGDGGDRGQNAGHGPAEREGAC